MKMLSRRLKCSVSFSSHGQWSEYLQWECLTVFQSSKSHNRVFRLSPALLYPGYSDIWLTSLIDCFLLYLEKKILLTDHLYSLVIYHWSYFYILSCVVTVTRFLFNGLYIISPARWDLIYWMFDTKFCKFLLIVSPKSGLSPQIN